MIRLQNILVATDFSDASASALNYGRDLARSYGATLHVLHVVEHVLAGYVMDAGYVGYPNLQKEIEEAARKQLETLVTADDRATIKARPVMRSSPAPAAAVVEYAQEEQIDLIVVGTHGRGGISHLLLGSVAEKVVRSAPCPVLTVRAHERDFLAPDALAKSAG